MAVKQDKPRKRYVKKEPKIHFTLPASRLDFHQNIKMKKAETPKEVVKEEKQERKSKFTKGFAALRSVIVDSLSYLFINNIKLDEFFERDLIRKAPYNRKSAVLTRFRGIPDGQQIQRFT